MSKQNLFLAEQEPPLMADLLDMAYFALRRSDALAETRWAVDQELSYLELAGQYGAINKEVFRGFSNHLQDAILDLDFSPHLVASGNFEHSASAYEQIRVYTRVSFVEQRPRVVASNLGKFAYHFCPREYRSSRAAIAFEDHSFIHDAQLSGATRLLKAFKENVIKDDASSSLLFKNCVQEVFSDFSTSARTALNLFRKFSFTLARVGSHLAHVKAFLKSAPPPKSSNLESQTLVGSGSSYGVLSRATRKAKSSRAIKDLLRPPIAPAYS